MREFKIKIALIFLAMGMGSQAFGHVSLSYPVGGESFSSNDIVTIEWVNLIPHGVANWDLYFSSDGGTTWSEIALNIPEATLTYDWTVPEINTSEGLVRVVQDNAGTDYEHASLKFTITIELEPPSIVDAAQDATFECSTENQAALIQNWLDDNGGASATSACGDLTWSNDYAGLTTSCGVAGSTLVIFTCTDECDKSNTSSATLTIADNTPPTIDISASDLIVECGRDAEEIVAWMESQGGASGSDACGTVEWSNDFNGVGGGCGNSGTVVVVFTVTDQCGNTNTTSATFNYEDTLPPVLGNEAQDITIECSSADQQVSIQAWIATHGGAVGGDLCGDVIWTNDFAGMGDQCGETGSASVTFTMTDECGFTKSTSAILTVEDTQPPAIEKMPQDISVECDDADRTGIISEWLSNNAGATASDLCGEISWTNNYTAPGNCVSQTEETVTLSATDICGNVTSVTAKIMNVVSTGLDDLFGISSFQVYPNPASDNLHIEFISNKNFEISIALYDTGGKLILQDYGVVDSWNFDVSSLNSGLYILMVITDKGSLARKVLIN